MTFFAIFLMSAVAYSQTKFKQNQVADYLENLLPPKLRR